MNSTTQLRQGSSSQQQTTVRPVTVTVQNSPSTKPTAAAGTRLTGVTTVTDRATPPPGDALVPSTGKTLQPFVQMQKSMLQELDRRRKDWEQEVERMQEDFFHVKLVRPECSTTNSQQLCLPPATPCDVTTNDTTLSRDVSNVFGYVQPEQPEYYVDSADGSSMCRWSIDVSGYKPEELSVRAEHGKLIVTARHVDHDNTNIRQFSKQLEIPRDVRHDRMTSYLSRDGRLNVLAPVQCDVNSPSRPRPLTDVMRAHINDDVTPSSLPISERLIQPRPLRDIATLPVSDVTRVSSSGHLASGHNGGCHGVTQPTEQRYFRPIEPPAVAIVTAAGCVDDVTTSSPRFVKTDDGQQMLKMVVDLGREDYTADDVTVTVSGACRRLTVEARHDETASGLKSVSRHFRRDIQLQQQIHEPSLRVMLDKTGRLWVAASTATNTDHRTINALSLVFMPRYATRCHIQSQ